MKVLVQLTVCACISGMHNAVYLDEIKLKALNYYIWPVNLIR